MSFEAQEDIRTETAVNAEPEEATIDTLIANLTRGLEAADLAYLERFQVATPDHLKVMDTVAMSGLATRSTMARMLLLADSYGTVNNVGVRFMLLDTDAAQALLIEKRREKGVDHPFAVKCTVKEKTFTASPVHNRTILEYHVPTSDQEPDHDSMRGWYLDQTLSRNKIIAEPFSKHDMDNGEIEQFKYLSGLQILVSLFTNALRTRYGHSIRTTT